MRILLALVLLLVAPASASALDLRVTVTPSGYCAPSSCVVAVSVWDPNPYEADIGVQFDATPTFTANQQQQCRGAEAGPDFDYLGKRTFIPRPCTFWHDYHGPGTHTIAVHASFYIGGMADKTLTVTLAPSSGAALPFTPAGLHVAPHSSLLGPAFEPLSATAPLAPVAHGRLRSRRGTNNRDTLRGTRGADVIRGLGGADQISGLGGDDVLYGEWSNDHLYGGAGQDWLDGSSGGDWLDGGDDADVLLGGFGTDLLEGGAGNDVEYGGPAPDLLDGGPGDDMLHGGSGTDRINGGDGNDLLFSDSSADSLDGGPGDDILFANEGAGNAEVNCGPGDDIALLDPPPLPGGRSDMHLFRVGGKISTCEHVYFIDPPARPANVGETYLASEYGGFHQGTDRDDNLLGRAGADVIEGRGGNDVIWGNQEPVPTDAFDQLRGGGGNDTIYGGGGRNAIEGGPGDDYLQGGEGRNTIFGGDGNDTIRLRGTGPNTVSGGAGNDHIMSYASGAATIRCGPGLDTVELSRHQQAASDCEHRKFH